MNSIPLMQMVLDAILFFGLSGDEVVQPDEAVKQLEAIAMGFQKMPLNERHEFLRFVETVANAEQKEGANSRRIEFTEGKGVRTILLTIGRAVR